MEHITRGGAAGVASTALAGPLFGDVKPHPQLEFCGLGRKCTLLIGYVFTFNQNETSY